MRWSSVMWFWPFYRNVTDSRQFNYQRTNAITYISVRSIGCGAGKCDITQPCIVFKQAFSWCRTFPKHGPLWVWLQGKADVLNPGVESWQANGKYFRLHGKKLCQSTPWWHTGGAGGDWCIAPHNLSTILGVSFWLHKQATLPQGKDPRCLTWCGHFM